MSLLQFQSKYCGPLVYAIILNYTRDFNYEERFKTSQLLSILVLSNRSQSRIFNYLVLLISKLGSNIPIIKHEPQILKDFIFLIPKSATKGLVQLNNLKMEKQEKYDFWVEIN